MTTTYIVIPARYQSTRLPEKPLLEIAGKPMIQHVYEQAQKTKADRVIIAADDDRIVKNAKLFNAEAYLTSSSHQSGTERIGEISDKLKFHDNDTVINLQCDEPMISPEIIDQLIDKLNEDTALKAATLCEPLTNIEELFNPNVCKVVKDQKNYALYFSRAPIPWDRTLFSVETHCSESSKQTTLSKDFLYYRHIGIYAFRTIFLKQYISWSPSPLEKIEALEQLRILWHGERIYVTEAVASSGYGVDTKADLDLVRKLLTNQR